jgi:RND family efflux transporter MFP subunit
MKTIFYKTSLIALSSFILLSCSDKTEEVKTDIPTDVIPVKVIELQSSNIKRVINASGQFTTEDETMLSFKTGGIINKIYVKEGEQIQKGQLLATLDLTEINAQVNQAQIGFEKAQRDFKRAENLYRDSVASIEQFQNAKSALDFAQQQLNAAKFNLTYSEIRSITDGVVLKKIMNEGQITGPGSPVIQINSKGNADWVLKVNLSDKDWASINIGDSALVQIDAIGKENLKSVVSSKSESVDFMTGSFSVDIKLINNKKIDIASGMFGKAIIHPKTNNVAWKIPYEALLDGNANEGYVFVTNDLKTAKKIAVNVGEIEDNNVCIKSGLENYKYIITSGSAYLTDNSLIKNSK